MTVYVDKSDISRIRHGKKPKNNLGSVRACVFDAYGTLFNFADATERCREEIGEKTDALTDIWRSRQLQYSWLRGMMGYHADFWQVTADALDYALEALDLTDSDLREHLLTLYMELDPYPEVKKVLHALRRAKVQTAILSNGSPSMLASAVGSAGIESLLDEVISVEDVGVFKPHPNVYKLVQSRLGVAPAEVAYLSANGWDACAGAAFGFQAVWINRGGAPVERIPDKPALILSSLEELPKLIGAV